MKMEIPTEEERKRIKDVVQRAMMQRMEQIMGIRKIEGTLITDEEAELLKKFVSDIELQPLPYHEIVKRGNVLNITINYKTEKL